MDHHCVVCHAKYSQGRHDLGYVTCLSCGEKDAKRVKHCVVPMHKGNYIPITDMSLLVQINSKGVRAS
jgi:ribosomal protein L37AE/L43A